MIASLGMYDFAWLKPANDRLWRAIAARLREAGLADVPGELSRDIDLDDAWRSPGLLLGQTCGYPLVKELRESVQLIATPRYRAEGCQGAAHRSAIVVRADDPAAAVGDLRGYHAGVNSLQSNTGMNLLRAAVAPEARGGRFFARVTITGSHAASHAAVASGKIDVAAIDAVTLAHLHRHDRRSAENVRIVAWTAASPGLPLITAVASPPGTVAALRLVLDEIGKEAKLRPTLDALLIESFEPLDLEDYRAVLQIEKSAIVAGYPEVA